MSKKWDRRFILLAKHVAGWSKDRTQVGAVLAKGNRLIGCAFNGFPPGIKDTPSRLDRRLVKLAMTIHGEANVLQMAGDRARGATLYTWPLPPCSHCASLAIQAGVQRVVSPTPSPDLAARWGASLRLARDMLLEAGVVVVTLDGQ